MDARRYLRQNDSDRVNRNAPRQEEPAPEWRRRSIAGSEQKPAVSFKERFSYWWKKCLTALKWLTAGGMLGALIWSIPVFWAWLDRPVASVGVGGDIRYLRADALQQRMLPYVQTTFFGLDLRAIQAELQSETWVSSAEVRKVWPDRVEVVLEEEVPIARWQGQDMINADGDILKSRLGHDFRDFPELAGPEGREQEVMQQYLTLSHQLRLLGLKVTGVELAAMGSWSFAVDDVSVQLGNEDLISRMQRFSRLYNDSLQARWAEVDSIDLRYRDGVAVAWNESPKASPITNNGAIRAK
ncbi:cell division protein FtsQ/DivIB [Parendozoicomonas haliclonae]|uniref:Cell division protein FtsQ n=1 Tax=Parendozoicomonas haliclonae TaxID=1960125 RepID=A0A1X7AED7_9GAMM|nr:cell division protein FtsQ/DivIB [Parendozoicomonas haliclonae]SMA34285.1 Cell division protein FtsQ [Parendozoicomonas haliclonae]